MDNTFAAENENRRSFLKKIGTVAASVVAAPAIVNFSAPDVQAQKSVVAEEAMRTKGTRAMRAMQLRLDCAKIQFLEPKTRQVPNADENTYSNRIGNFSKTLPHNHLGEVEPNAYAALLAAVYSGNQNDYAMIPQGGAAKLANPLGATAFQLEGADCAHLSVLPAPALDSQAEAAEITELYWHALLRDVPFSQYGSDELVEKAVKDLRKFPLFQNVSATTLFRGETAGDAVGPYVSQFLWKPVPYGAMTIEQRYRVPLAGQDKMTDYAEWLNIQNGFAPTSPLVYDSTTRYIRNGRDLGEYVHLDFSYQAFLNAALILLGYGGAALSSSNPYKIIVNQGGFVQFGAPHVLDMVSRAAIAALKSVWFQKWNVHRRLRPEEFGGLVHKHLTGAASYPISGALNTAALAETFNRHGSYLLPQAFAEGCPAHPAYPAGHAAIAGACATVLKAFFKDSYIVPNPVEASDDGTALNDFNGQLTVGGELNKLAANISLGRDMAGVHWRSDGIQGILLGEKVAIQILKDYRQTYAENFSGFAFKKFNGESVTI